MWSPDRRLFLLGALGLAACGFAPAYGPGSPAAALLDQVAIDPPSDKDGFDLVERLEERLGRAKGARWRLAYAIAVQAENRTLTPGGAITRYNLNGSTAWTLHDIATGDVVAKGSVSTFTSYSASGTAVATRASEADARLRLMRLLADQIVIRLIAAAPAR